MSTAQGSAVQVPDIGDFDEVAIIEILVAVGDAVSAEDPLVTLESDKATMDVPAPFDGVVTEIGVAVSDNVSHGSELMTIQPAGSDGDGDGGPGRIGARGHPADPSQTSEGAGDGDGDGESEGSSGPPNPPAQPPTDNNGGGSEREFQVVVLGSGPGGDTAAFRAADLGLKVALIERHERLGGVCLNVGCIPSKALLHAARVITETEEIADHGTSFGTPKIDLQGLIGWKQSVVNRLTGGLGQLATQRKVEVIRGDARLLGPNSVQVGEREVTFENCIIAAGSQSARIPGLPDDPRVIDSTGALSPDSIPNRMLVIGGGIIGLEMARVYLALGTKVTVVEMLDQLITGADPDLVEPLAKRLTDNGVEIMLSTRVEGVRAQKNGASSRSTRRCAPTCPGSTRSATSSAGRCSPTKPAKVAAETIAGQNVTFDARTIPSVANTDPEGRLDGSYRDRRQGRRDRV